MKRMVNPTALTTPCADCPFRSDIRPFLTKTRARDIWRSISAGAGGWFQCHKTLDGAAAKQYCAGSMILLEKVGKPTQWMQVAERLGLGYDHTKLNMNAPVFNSPEEFIAAQDER